MTRPVTIVAVASMLFVGAVQASEQPAEVKVLCDFESADVLAGWHVRDLTDFALTNEWSTSGQSAAEITYHKWSEGQEQWPAVIANRGGGAWVTEDLSIYGELKLDFYNPQDFEISVTVHMRDTSQNRFSQGMALPPQTAKTLSIRIKEIRQRLDVTSVGELHIYTTRPERTYRVLVDNIRVNISLPGDVAAFAQRVAALADEFRALTPNVSGIAAEQCRLGGAGTQDLAQDAQALAGEVSQSLGDVAVLKALCQRLDKLEARYASLQGRVNTITLAPHYAAGNVPFVLATESPMRKVFLEAARFSSTPAREYRMAAARNEYESCQIIVRPLYQSLSAVKWELSQPRNGDGVVLPATVRLVGYVDCAESPYDTPHTGWWPDPLLDFMTEVDAVPAHEVLPLWVTVHVPEDAPAGDYTGKLTVSLADGQEQSVQLRVQVWDFAIPKHTHLRTALSLRGAAQLYPDANPAQIQRKYENWMLEEYHLNPGCIYAGSPPSWDVERLRELKALGLNAINLGYVYAPREPDFDAAAHWQRFERQMARVEEYLPIAEAAGVRDLCYIYCFDERPKGQLDVVFETAAKIKQRWPDIEVMTTAYDTTFGLERDNGAAVDIWVPLTPHFDGNAPKIAQARTAGRDIWWYICCGPLHPHANWFVEYPAIEARLLMGAMTAKYRPGGFLYYAVNRWPLNEKVITGGPRTDWNPASFRTYNGDGSIMCAGPNGPLATIRLENIRDGIEDYEYYLLLRKLINQTGTSQQIGMVADSVVTDLTHYTHDPKVVLVERERVARQILRLSSAEVIASQ